MSRHLGPRVPADEGRGLENRFGVCLVELKRRCQMAVKGGVGYAKTIARRKADDEKKRNKTRRF